MTCRWCEHLNLMGPCVVCGSTEPPSTPDPHSQEAAESVRLTAGTKRAMVLAEIEKRPSAEWELERALGWPGNTVRPRLWELERAGLIRKGASNKTPSGRSAWIYEVAPHG